MFSKIARATLVVLTVAVVGCSQVLDLVGLGSKPSPVRQPKNIRTLTDESVSSPKPIIYTPLPAPNTATTFAPATTITPGNDSGTLPTPAGSPSLTANIIDLGEGLREMTNVATHNWHQVVYRNYIPAVSAVVTDTAGHVYLLIDMIWIGDMQPYGPMPDSDGEGVFRLESLASNSARFSLVSEAPSVHELGFDMLYGGQVDARDKTWQRFGKLLASASIVVVPDVVSGLASGSVVVLSEDAENRWGQPTVSLDRVDEMKGDLGIGARYGRIPISVGNTTAVSLAAGNPLVSVRRNGPTEGWHDLTAPAPEYLIPINRENSKMNEWGWFFRHTWYSPRWPATTGGHWIWVGNLYGRVFLYPDK